MRLNSQGTLESLVLACKIRSVSEVADCLQSFSQPGFNPATETVLVLACLPSHKVLDEPQGEVPWL